MSDGHTVSDRPYLDAPAVIRHHNWGWLNMIVATPAKLAVADEQLAAFAKG